MGLYRFTPARRAALNKARRKRSGGGGIGYPRNKKQNNAYKAQKARLANYSYYYSVPPRSTIQY
jgi:hypothetical protein